MSGRKFANGYGVVIESATYENWPDAKREELVGKTINLLKADVSPSTAIQMVVVAQTVRDLMGPVVRFDYEGKSVTKDDCKYGVFDVKDTASTPEGLKDEPEKKFVYFDEITGEVKAIDWRKYVKDTDLAVKIIDRQIEERKIDIKGASIIVAGGYGMGSKENFRLVHELADVLGAEVGASRAAVDAGFTEHARQVGQTGVTVRPKLYIACGISGQIQHTAGMDQSSMVISINTDPEAPINKIADYAITGDVNEIIPKMIKYYKQNSK